jgi:AcrR family transcriptional regulator
VPSARLNPTRVVEEAERIADEVGLPRLTLTLLAERLNVRQPSLYKHIDGMPGLQHRITVRGKQELAEILARSAVGRARGDAVVAIAHAYRRWALEHPGRYAAAQPAPIPGDVEDEAASSDVVDAMRFVRAALHGFVTLEAPTAGGFALPVDIDRSFDRLVQAVVGALADWRRES